MRFAFSIIICLSSVLLLAQQDNYKLVWSDEFDGQGAIDSTKWHHQTQLPNGVSWFNGEIQHYTNRLTNSYVSDGTLKIVSKKEDFTDQGVTRTHTSARLNSKFAFTYGYLQIRAKLPSGTGTWPALWMLGQHIKELGGYWEPTHGAMNWPNCGEIDIMEHWGRNQNFVQSAIHNLASYGDTVNKGGQQIKTASTDFHIYDVLWTSNRISFSIDGKEHYVYEPKIKNTQTWPFDTNQYLLLNVALLPEISPSFTQSIMEIDYVRIYQDPDMK